MRTTWEGGGEGRWRLWREGVESVSGMEAWREGEENFEVLGFINQLVTPLAHFIRFSQYPTPRTSLETADDAQWQFGGLKKTLPLTSS
eukprot:619038-Hanusia_phi.AAC.1